MRRATGPGQPIVAGWADSWSAQLGVARERWTAPQRVRRPRPQETSTVEQRRAMRWPPSRSWPSAPVCTRLPAHNPHSPVPRVVFAAGSDPVQLTPSLGAARAALLMRLRAG
jgi:hypothetical protein